MAGAFGAVQLGPRLSLGLTEEEQDLVGEFLGLWGTDAYAKAFREEEEAHNNPLPPEHIAIMAMQTRNACTPDVAARLSDIWYETDVRGVLAAIQTPTLLLVHEDRRGDVEETEYIASHTPAAEVRRMPGLLWEGRGPACVGGAIICDFVGVERPHPAFDTVLSTVLFTDIVGSTERQAAVGDRAWRDLAQQHHALVREALKRWHGKENDTAGDGFYATFDGPARAIRCAFDVIERLRDLGIETRAGIHTGERQFIEGKPTGLTVTESALASLQEPDHPRCSPLRP